jgi:transcriptional accessory protein Tex/SPT6
LPEPATSLIIEPPNPIQPFKEKKNTKATIAKAKGLEPLADILAKAQLSKEEFELEAEKLVRDTGDVKTSVKNKEEAIQ